MTNQVIHTENAPAAIGPYSQAVKAGNMLFVSGQVPFVPETMEIVEGDVKAQTAQSLKNLQAILKEAGAEALFLNHAENPKTVSDLYAKDMNEFAQINEVYAEFFGENKPARACVEVARLPKDVKVEIELIAVL